MWTSCTTGFCWDPLILLGHRDCEEVSPYWRRGHFPMQTFGPQHSLRKVIFIAPTLVSADRLGGAGTGNVEVTDGHSFFAADVC